MRHIAGNHNAEVATLLSDRLALKWPCPTLAATRWGPVPGHPRAQSVLISTGACLSQHLILELKIWSL